VGSCGYLLDVAWCQVQRKGAASKTGLSVDAGSPAAARAPIRTAPFFLATNAAPDIDAVLRVTAPASAEALERHRPETAPRSAVETDYGSSSMVRLGWAMAPAAAHLRHMQNARYHS